MLRNLTNSIKSIGVKLNEPVFIKDYSSQQGVIDELETLKLGIDDSDIIKSIDRDIKMIGYGDNGEKQVAYELKNSYLPMYCLHNITLEHNGLKAQFDFILITNKGLVVLETKKLNGNIEIRNTGDFIRSFKSNTGKTYKKEGMYSPITQNERHVELLSKFLKHHKLIKHAPVYSLVVMANPKSILNHKYAPKVIKEKIVKYDQLNKKIKSYIDVKSDINLPIYSMFEIADHITKFATEPENTFVNKYEKYKLDVLKTSDTVVKDIEATLKKYEKNPIQKVEAIKTLKREVPSTKKNDETLTSELKAYRLKTCRAEGIKAYMIFNNAQMEEMIKAYPTTKEELISLKGFGPVKYEKYGIAILKIFSS